MNFVRHNPIDSRGLTLAELLVAIAIIAVAAAISAPFYRTVTMNLDLSAASRDLASDLRYAQQLSVTTQTNYQVVFYAISNSYAVKNSVTGVTVKSRTVKSPITILSISGLTGNAATFNSTGAAVDTGTIVLTNPEYRTSTVSIKPSGYVKIN